MHIYVCFFTKGIDQLKEVLRRLRFDRTSRRNILLSWNPNQVAECVLPPCHCMAQFRVLREKELHCHLTQRSADFALGVPYNIASYAILTHIMAKLSGLEATKLIISFGDVHLYEPHWITAVEQIARKPMPPPKLLVDLPEYNPMDPISIDAVTFDRFRLTNYKSHGKLTYPLCV